MAPTIVLISGANRGIGKGILELYLSKPNHTVIAANRDPNHPSSKALADLPTAEGSSLVLVKVDATVSTDALEAVKQLESQGIDHIDIVIANAGVCYAWPKVSEVKAEDIQGHFVPNVHGFIWLYQATLPLLKKSKLGKFISIGSSAGYLTVILFSNLSSPLNQLDMPNSAYAPSKVSMHWLTKAIHREEPTLIAFPIDPGWVQTDLGNIGANHFGFDAAPLGVAECAAGLDKVIAESTRETHGGKLYKWDGEVLPW
ncbi:uncharacterized protein EAE98_010319 [Botrytis deweyae]|uniref:Uncharacterized protein n=1 Tax=Botrytis deweyae TaxID=2478750 RepID=A0ABQ7I975_9HELO|nr:uncharacterized protein EAE98_010319 [Botrytis deweyae]KAF7917214.1 hypothetical protein EAE98_010319 [Botrytis deweyae]